MECDIAKNSSTCACTYTTCARHGKCCECLRHHWSRRELPGCLFPPAAERTYDRSLDHFIQVHS